MKHILFASAAALTLATTAQANEFAPAMESYLQSNLRAWAQSDVIVSAIQSQNAQTAGYDQAMIDTLDTNWRAEVGQTETPTITPVLNNAAADFLRSQVEMSGGQITEVFIMD